MLLSRIEITDFLSVRGTLPIDLDKKVTILLGSNDHGKSNILRAIEHLNEDTPITEDERNWDADSEPEMSFTLTLAKAETDEWNGIVQEIRNRNLEAKSVGSPAAEEPAAQKAAAPPAKAAPPGAPTPAKAADPELELPEEALAAVARTLKVARKGAGSPLTFYGVPLDDIPSEMSNFLVEKLPRVELFKTLTGNLQDSATATTIGTDEFEFLQGVFFYAGLDPLKSASLFTQDDRTMRRLDVASEKLDASLRSLWGQGTDLHFELAHKGNEILFLADDPAIKSRKARMSKRSAGVTQFFRVSMVLYARRKKHPANSYIYLFDEPGVLLHPRGQRDLLQVFEELADENQIIYATHSLFLLNQNFPERHRLIYKDQEGTKVDQKPYRQNWKLATDALGVYLTSNILFSNRIALVEGDSDPIYLYELFRQLNKSGELDVDLNTLGIMSFYDRQNLRFLLQVFKREGPEAQVCVVADGDAEGKAGLVPLGETNG
jgi:predicted ATPase